MGRGRKQITNYKKLASDHGFDFPSERGWGESAVSRGKRRTPRYNLPLVIECLRPGFIGRTENCNAQTYRDAAADHSVTSRKRTAKIPPVSPPFPKEGKSIQSVSSVFDGFILIILPILLKNFWTQIHTDKHGIERNNCPVLSVKIRVILVQKIFGADRKRAGPKPRPS
jgi:hypothetical protein